MRTLKKTLCLVLALVMVLGLCAFNVSAEFTDAASIEYKEAVGVMQAAGVLSGFEDGSFRPGETLTRAQAATMIACMMGFSGLKGKTEFTDCQGHWAEGAIAFCASEGIVSGYGDGTFGPNDTLTGSQWAVMLVGAIGYDHKSEGITGASWEIGVTKKIKALGLSDNIAGFDGTKPISRDQACELGFQAMQADMVKYTPGISVNGVEIPGTTATISPKTNLLKGLGITETTPETVPALSGADLADAYGRPNASVWKNADKKTVYANAVPAAYSFTAAANTTGTGDAAVIGDLNTALKLTNTAKALDTAASITMTLNGTDVTDGSEALKAGDSVEVYLDATDTTGKTVSKIVVIRYQMATVDSISAKTGAIKLSVGNSIAKPAAGATSADYDAVKGFAKDDVLAICVKTGKTVGTDADAILDVVKAGTVEGKVSARDASKGTVNVAGTKYTVATGATVTDMDAGNEGTLYLAPNGAVIGFVKTKEAAAANYAFVVASYYVDESTTYGYTRTHYVQAVDMSGNVVSYAYKPETQVENPDDPTTVDAADYVGELVEVTALTGKDAGKYTFSTSVAAPNTDTIETATAKINATDKRIGTTYFTSDVKFIYVSGSLDNLKVTVKSGVQAVNATDSEGDNIVKTYVAKKAGSAKTTSAVFVTGTYETPVVTTSNVAFVIRDAVSTNKVALTNKDGKADFGWEKTVYIDGEKTTIYVSAADQLNSGNAAFYAVSKNGDLTELDPDGAASAENLKLNATFDGYYDGTLSFTAGGTKYDLALASDAIVVNTLIPTAANSDAGLADLQTATISVVLSADGKTVTTVYITEISAVIG